MNWKWCSTCGAKLAPALNCEACGADWQAVAEDAERYRFLRTAGNEAGQPFIATRDAAHVVVQWKDELADRAVDSARLSRPLGG